MENNRENAVRLSEGEETDENYPALDLREIEELAAMCKRLNLTYLELENKDFKLVFRKNQAGEMSIEGVGRQRAEGVGKDN